MINGREYEFADLSVVIGGYDLSKLRGIKFSEKIEREAVFGKGRHAASIQSGNITIEGEVSMLQSDYETLVVSGNGSVLNINADFVLNYGNPPNTPISKTIVGARFTEASEEWKQGDKNQEITLPFIALAIVQ